MARLTDAQKTEMVDAAIARLTSSQAEYMQNVYDGSRAGLSSYAEDQAALRGIGLVTSRETRYSERWKETSRELQHTATTIDGVTVPATVRGKVVKVIAADGTTSYRSASSFRKQRNTRSGKRGRTTIATQAPEVVRMTTTTQKDFD